MKLFPVIPLCLAGALAGSGIGWLLRGKSRPVDTSLSVSEAPASAPSGPSAAAAPPPRGQPLTKNSPASHTAFSAVRETGGPLRWLVLLGEADETDAAHMPALIKAAAGEWVVVSLLARRWAELDPQHMFKTLRADALTNQPSLDQDGGLLYALFAHWATADPDAAIAALKEPIGLAGDEIRPSVACSIMESDPARGLKLIADWKIRNATLPVSILGKWMEENPRAAAEAATAGDLGRASKEIMKRIGTAWAASDPAAALAFAAKKHGAARLHLAEAVIAEWARRDLKAAVAHLAAEPDAAIRGKLGLPIVESWAARDPQAALLWANENLKGAARNSAAASIVKGMAEKDAGAAAEFIAGLEEGSAKNQSVDQLLRTWLGRNRPEDGAAAFQWIVAMPAGITRRRALEEWGDQFVDSALDTVTAFLGTPEGAAAPSDMFRRTAHYLAQKNAETAIQWAEKAPPARRTAARDAVLKEWLTTRPDAATEWVRALPPGEVRTRSVSATAAVLSASDAAAAGTWLRTLPAADHPAARQGLTSNLSLSDESRANLEALVR